MIDLKLWSFVLIGVLLHSPINLVRGAEVNYLRDIKPLLKTKCFACHGALEQSATLRLDTVNLMKQGGDSGPAIVPHHPEESLLLERVAATDAADRMPPEGEPLTAAQIALLRDWIQSGAIAPDDEVPQLDPSQHWAFQPLKRPAITETGAAAIDAMIAAKLAEQQLHRSPQADPEQLIRRLYLDVHGLPPAWNEVASFVGDHSPHAWEQQVEKVLNSPRYGERWGQHWLDIVRYADTHGFEVNTPRPNAWPYRDYVIQSFNEDKPYDQFIREQLAGDRLGADAATGFLVAAAVLLPGQIGKDDASKRLARQDALDEMIVGTSATFLGLTIGCARCHDHKFDPVAQRDYYCMQAFFAGVDYGDRPLRDAEASRREQELSALLPKIEALTQELTSFAPQVHTGRTLIVDDEDAARTDSLIDKNGHGTHPDGTARGYKNDAGNDARVGNLGGGRYTWWTNTPGQDVFIYKPHVEGRFGLWISWGVHGSGVHTRDARYVFDRDGDRETVDDQQEIARVDQYYFAGVNTGETEQKPLWSGLLATTILDWQSDSILILRGGETGTGITADAIVLQECAGDTIDEMPHLRAPVTIEKNEERFPGTLAKAVRFTTYATMENNRLEPCIDELEVFAADNPERNVALASAGAVPSTSGEIVSPQRHELRHINDGQYGNSRSWLSNSKQESWVQLDFPEAVTINRIVWGRDREGKLRDRLPVDYRIEALSPDNEWQVVATSADRVPFQSPYDAVSATLREVAAGDRARVTDLQQRLKKLEKQRLQLQKPREVYAGVFHEPEETYLLRRGDPEQRVEAVGPAFPHHFDMSELSSELTDAERRLALGEWIVSGTPLTARVIANRIWQYHFGVGLVSTPSDFGLNGQAPSHPELLDWLALELIDAHWSLKHLHRLILSSKTYQQASRIDARMAEIDADCRLLWRFPSRRLEAEAVRDTLLFVSGELNLQMGGPGFDFFKSRGGLSGFPPVDQFGPDRLRRMVYAHKVRMEPVPVFGAFDCPDAGQAMPLRSQSTTAIQALNLFNSPFVIERATATAERAEQAADTLSEQVRFVIRTALGREPEAEELQVLAEVAQQHSLATVCRAILNSNEFLFIP